MAVTGAIRFDINRHRSLYQLKFDGPTASTPLAVAIEAPHVWDTLGAKALVSIPVTSSQTFAMKGRYYRYVRSLMGSSSFRSRCRDPLTHVVVGGE